MSAKPYGVVELAEVCEATGGRAVAAMLVRGEDIIADFFDPAEARKACDALNTIDAFRASGGEGAFRVGDRVRVVKHSDVESGTAYCAAHPVGSMATITAGPGVRGSWQIDGLHYVLPDEIEPSPSSEARGEAGEGDYTRYYAIYDDAVEKCEMPDTDLRHFAGISAVVRTALSRADAAERLYEDAMEAIHRNAGVRRNGLCGILAWIDEVKSRATAAEGALAKLRAYVECEDALAQDADLDARRTERPLDVLKRHGWNGVEAIDDFMFRLRRTALAASRREAKAPPVCERCMKPARDEIHGPVETCRENGRGGCDEPQGHHAFRPAPSANRGDAPREDSK